MCGIVGIHNRDGRPVSPADLHRATNLLAHRGPDDCGYVLIDTSSNQATEAADESTIAAARDRFARVETLIGRHDLGFGHRRLSIIDLSPGGHQPMADAQRQHWITYNG